MSNTWVEKSTGILWVEDPVPQKLLDPFDIIFVGNENGVFKKEPRSNFDMVRDEFDDMVLGKSKKSLKYNCYVPDMSLMKYLNMSEEEKESRRNKIIDKGMKHFEVQLQNVINKISKNGYVSPIAKIVHNSDGREKYFEERIKFRADAIFDLKLVEFCVFDGKLFQRTSKSIFHLIENIPKKEFKRFAAYCDLLK